MAAAFLSPPDAPGPLPASFGGFGSVAGLALNHNKLNVGPRLWCLVAALLLM